MGVDIDGWIEKKIDGKWVGITRLSNYDNKRCYIRFDRIFKAISEGKGLSGLPKDISETAKFWSENACSPFHMQLSVAIEVWHDEYAFDYVPYDENTNNIGQFRLVGWFDQEYPQQIIKMV